MNTPTDGWYKEMISLLARMELDFPTINTWSGIFDAVTIVVIYSIIQNNNDYFRCDIL